MATETKMNVPLLDLNAQLEPIAEELQRAVAEVVASGRYVMGPKVEALEHAIADYCGADFGVGVSSGTDALLAALMALDAGPDDLVITTPFSFFATIGAIARLGATPVLVDIEASSYNMDPKALASWFDEHGGDIERVKAVIPVHLYGQCADMDAIRAITDRFRVPIIEDAAQAIGASYPSGSTVKRAGSMGLMGCFSFFPTKNLGGIGDGGMITTNDEEVAQRLQVLRNHGSRQRYYHECVGGNFRLDEVQAAALLVKLDYLDDWHAARRANAAYYTAHLTSGHVQTPALAYGLEHHIFNQYVIRVPERRDGLKRFLNDHGVGCEVYYPLCFHEQECFRGTVYRPGDFPVSEGAAREVLALPIYPELTRPMQDYVVAKIDEFFASSA